MSKKIIYINGWSQIPETCADCSFSWGVDNLGIWCPILSSKIDANVFWDKERDKQCPLKEFEIYETF